MFCDGGVSLEGTNEGRSEKSWTVRDPGLKDMKEVLCSDRLSYDIEHLTKIK